MISKANALGFGCVLLLFCVQMAIYSQKQPRIGYGNGRGDDGVAYGKLADQFAAHQPLRGGAPFVYRLGGSFIAASYANALGISVDEAYQHTSAGLTVLVLAMMYVLALRVCSPMFATLATCAFSLPWFGHTRAVWFYPVQNDLPWVLLTVCALLVIDSWRDEPTALALEVPLFALLCLLSPLAREIGLLTPLLWIGARLLVLRRQLPSRPTVTRHALLALLFLSLSAVGFAIPRFIATNTGEFHWAGGSYGVVPTALRSIQDNTVWHLTLSVCLAYGGPLLALLFVHRRSLLSLTHRAPVLFVYWAVVLVLAYVGGVNTLRFLCWAAPSGLIVIAHLAERLWSGATGDFKGLHARLALVVAGAYYVVMIHPFSGYFADYGAWIAWGGLQFSAFRSAIALIPCLGLAAWLFAAGKMVRYPYLGPPSGTQLR